MSDDSAPRSDEEPAVEPVLLVPEETPETDVDITIVNTGDENTGEIAALRAEIEELKNRLAALEEYNDESTYDGSGDRPADSGEGSTGNPITVGAEEETRPTTGHWWFRKLR